MRLLRFVAALPPFGVVAPPPPPRRSSPMVWVALVVVPLVLVLVGAVAVGAVLAWRTLRGGAGASASGELPRSTDPFAETVSVAPPLPKTDVDRSLPGTPISVGAPRDSKALLDTIRAAERRPGELPAASASARSALTSSGGYALSGKLYELQTSKEASARGGLGAEVVLALPLSAEQLAAARTAAGAVVLDRGGSVYVAGQLDRARGRVLVRTSHLSLWEAAVPDAKTQLASFVREQAQRRVASAQEKLEEKAIDAAKIFVDSKLKGPGGKPLDGGVKSAILAGIVSQRERIADMAKASGEGDFVEFNKNLNLLVGKAVVDGAPPGMLKGILGSVVDNPDAVAKLADAAGNVAEGRYWEAAELLGKAYSEKTPIYKAIVAAARVEGAIMGAWVRHEFEEAYRLVYKRDEPWEQIEYSAYFGEIKQHLRMAYPGADKMSDEQLSKLAQRLFAERRAREQAEEAEAQRLQAQYAFLAGYPTLLERLGQGTGGDERIALGRFVRILSSIERELVRMGVKEPWVIGAKFVGQKQMLDLLGAYVSGGPAAYWAKVAALAKAAERYRKAPANAPASGTDCEMIFKAMPQAFWCKRCLDPDMNTAEVRRLCRECCRPR